MISVYKYTFLSDFVVLCLLVISDLTTRGMTFANLLPQERTTRFISNGVVSFSMSFDVSESVLSKVDERAGARKIFAYSRRFSLLR